MNVVKEKLEETDSSEVRRDVKEKAEGIVNYCYDDSLEELRVFKRLFDEHVLEELQELTAVLTKCAMPLKQLLVEECCEVGLIKLIGKAFIYLFSGDCDTDQRRRKVLQCDLLEFICTSTDATVKASKILGDIGIVPVLLGFIQSDQFSEDDSEFSDDSEDEEINVQRNYSEVAALGCIFNISKLPEFEDDYEQSSAVEILRPYLVSSNNKEKQMLALCTMASLFAESEISQQLLDRYGVINHLVNVLHEALEQSDHRSRGFTAEEVVDSLTDLAINDNNKQQLIDAEVIPALQTMLAVKGTVNEQLKAVDCLWALAFNEEIRQVICQTRGLVGLVEGLHLATVDDELKVRTKQAVDFIKHGKDGLEELIVKGDNKSRTDNGHIMISYSWKQQKIVLQIRQLLVDAGYKVWIDVDRMTGSTLEAMASAIENARIVLVCYSEDYRLSNPCRCEAEYAFRLKKPIVPVKLHHKYRATGWLGILIGARLYIDFSLQGDGFHEAAEKLIMEIQNHLREKSQSAKSHHVASGTSIKHLSSWTAGKVSSWLREQGLERFLKNKELTRFDGRAICGLLDMKATAPDLYHQQILKLFNGSLIDSLHFTIALRSLT